MDGRRDPAIEARVRHVDGEAEGGSESLRCEPRVIARTARRVAGEVPGHDLSAPLVVELRHPGRLDRHHRRVGGEVGHLGGAQLEELRPHARGRQLGCELPVRPPRPRRGRPRRALRPPSGRPRGRSPPRARPCRPGAGRWRHVPRGLTPRARSRGRGRLPPRARCSRSGRRSPGRSLRWPAASRATPSLTGPTNWTSTSASPRSGASFAASEGRCAGSTWPPASRTSRMSSRRACAGAAQAVHVVPGRLDQREVLVARHHARVRARESELSAGRVRHDEQVPRGVRARRLGTGERRAGDQRRRGRLSLQPDDEYVRSRYGALSRTRDAVRELEMYRQRR